MAESPSSSRLGWIYAGIAILIITPIIGIYLMTAGMVGGEEFCPDDFSQRNFFYNKAPWIGTTLWGLTHETKNSVLQKRLIADGLIQPTGNKTWHLVRDNTTDPNLSSAYDARILVDYLNMSDDSFQSYWDRWIDEHPKSAKIFWPAVADLARHKLYWAIPEVMRLAIHLKTDGDPDFAQRLKRATSDAFILQGKRSQQRNDHALAVELFDQALNYVSTNETRLLRQRSLDKIPSPHQATPSGDPDKSTSRDVQSETDQQD